MTMLIYECSDFSIHFRWRGAAFTRTLFLSKSLICTWNVGVPFLVSTQSSARCTVEKQLCVDRRWSLLLTLLQVWRLRYVCIKSMLPFFGVYTWKVSRFSSIHFQGFHLYRSLDSKVSILIMRFHHLHVNRRPKQRPNVHFCVENGVV